MCKAKEKEEPPCLYTEETARGDYNARLGYGTDQGRWLVEQVRGRRLRSRDRLSAAASFTVASLAAAGGRQGGRAQKGPPVAAGLPRR
jgi:hypothetical protein